MNYFHTLIVSSNSGLLQCAQIDNVNLLFFYIPYSDLINIFKRLLIIEFYGQKLFF
jgi:hypothetical protein